MNAQETFLKSLDFDDLETLNWIGEVVDNNDPEFQGRCRVRVFGKFDGTESDDSSKFTIPDEHLPWAFPSGSNIFAGGSSKGAGSLSIPKKGTRVKVRFSGGNIYAPEYFSIQDVSEALIDEISGSYENAHVLLFDEDEDLKVIYTKERGLEIYHKKSHFLINPDSSIMIEHADSKSFIELIGPVINITANSTVNVTANTKVSVTANECLVNGKTSTKLGPAPVFSAAIAEPVWTAFKILASAIDAKLPSTPGVFSGQINALEQMGTSSNVKLSK